MNNRIRGRTPRTETLDWYDAKDSERVVRTYQEVDVSPVSPSSTSGCESSRLEIDHWTKLTQASLKTMCVWVGKWTRFLRWRVQLHRIRGWVVSFRPFTEINASVRKGRADNYRKGTRKLRARVQLQDTRQKDRSKKRIHSVNPFCFVVFRPQSLLYFLESRVMKRKWINHCEERSEMTSSTSGCINNHL